MMMLEVEYMLKNLQRLNKNLMMFMVMKKVESMLKTCWKACKSITTKLHVVDGEEWKVKSMLKVM